VHALFKQPSGTLRLRHIFCLQVYCGWGSSDCVMRAGQKVFLPPEAVQARAGGNASIQ